MRADTSASDWGRPSHIIAIVVLVATGVHAFLPAPEGGHEDGLDGDVAGRFGPAAGDRVRTDERPARVFSARP